MSSRIPVGRGVKQGDPMSPTLFNAIVDMILGEVDRSIGITGDAASKIKCNYIAFVDDLLLMSTTDIGMQMLLMQLEGAMAKVGLVMNANKCASMSTEINIARKLWIVNPEPPFKL